MMMSIQTREHTTKFSTNSQKYEKNQYVKKKKPTKTCLCWIPRDRRR